MIKNEIGKQRNQKYIAQLLYLLDGKITAKKKKNNQNSNNK